MEYKVDRECLLFEFLLEKTNKKRQDIKNLLKYKHISVNGEVVTHYAYELKLNQIVSINTKQQALPIDILYEDKDLIVINKPCGLLSEQTDREKNKTAFAYVKGYLAKKGESVYLVHRLDQFTSGVLMFVKNRKLYDELTRHWNDYVKVRGYVALVEGRMRKKQETLIHYLAESKTQNIYITSKEQGKKAITHYKVIKENKAYSLLEVRLDTGRKNQIRVQLSSISHPIVGDDKYNASTNPIKRLGLHANILEIVHPFTHKRFKFVAKTPEIFEKVFKKN